MGVISFVQLDRFFKEFSFYTRRTILKSFIKNDQQSLFNNKDRNFMHT